MLVRLFCKPYSLIGFLLLLTTIKKFLLMQPVIDRYKPDKCRVVNH